MPSMRAVLVKEGEGKTAKGMYIGDTDKPVPKEGELLVKVKAFGLNRADTYQRAGGYPVPPGVSSIMGLEFSGIVEEAKGSQKFKAGDEVFGLAYGGAYAEYIAVLEGTVSHKPSHITWAQAASIPETWLTAFQALFVIADFQPRQKVLVHAGASGVGLCAIQLARAFGASEIFATVGTAEKVTFVEKYGAKGINYKKEDFSEKVLAQTNNQGVDVIIDFVGQTYWDKNIASLARDGRLLLLGLLGGALTEKPLNMAPFLQKRIRVEGTTLRSRTPEYQADLLKQFTAKALDKVLAKEGEGGLDLIIHKVYHWNDIVAAHEEIEADRNIGKIVCEVKP